MSGGGPMAERMRMVTTALADTALITREGYAELTAELHELSRAGAAPAGDNDDDHEAQLLRERRLDEVRATLARACVVDPPRDGTAGIGSSLEVRISGSPTPARYRLVGPLEGDVARGDISVRSPIGVAVLGGRAGDVVDVETPSGPRRVEILHVAGYL